MARVLLLAPDLSRNSVYPPWQLAGALARAGHESTLAGPASGVRWPPLASELAGAVELPGRWAGLPRARAAVRAAREVDVLYAFKAMPQSLGVGLRARKAAGRPLMLHLDDWDAGFFEGVSPLRRAWYGVRALHVPEGDLWLRVCERRVSRADALTVSSRALERRYGGTLVRQGVDTERWDPERFRREEARNRVGADPDAPMVLFLGTPRLHKGLARSWLRELRGALWLVGAPREALAEAGADEALLDGATVRSAVPFTEATWYLAACDVFVIPQVRTPYAEHQLPAKLLHAMALGCAIVSSDVGDARELLEGSPPAGVVVPAGDDGAHRDAVRALLDDPGAARALGAEARRRAVAEHGWAAMARRLDPIVSSLTGRG